MKIEPLQLFIARIIKIISMGTNVNLLSNNPFLKESAKQINFNSVHQLSTIIMLRTLYY